jgi:polyphosphate kinase
MFARIHTDVSPWTIVRADDKHAARLNVLRDMLSRLHYGGKDRKLTRPDATVVYRYSPALRTRGRIAT